MKTKNLLIRVGVLTFAILLVAGLVAFRAMAARAREAEAVAAALAAEKAAKDAAIAESLKAAITEEHFVGSKSAAPFRAEDVAPKADPKTAPSPPVQKAAPAPSQQFGSSKRGSAFFPDDFAPSAP